MTDRTSGRQPVPPSGLETPAGIARFRYMDPPRDYPELAQLIGEVNRHDGLDWVPTPDSLAAEWSPGAAFDPHHDALLVTVNGALMGAATVEWRERSGRVVHHVGVWVHPGSRRHGLGRALLAWAEDRARATVAEGRGGPPELPHTLGLWVGLSVIPGVRCAEAAGYEPIRYSFEMRRRLDQPIPDPPVPNGIEIRPMRREEHHAAWEAGAEAFRDHWDAAVRTEEDFLREAAHPDLDPSLSRIAWEGEQVAGVVESIVFAHENEVLGVRAGWIYGVAVRRPWRRRGLATALVAAALRALADRGMERAALNVDSENPHGALGLYERLGFVRHRTEAFYQKPL